MIYNKWFGAKSYQDYLNSYVWKDLTAYIKYLEEHKDENNKRLGTWTCEKCKKIIKFPQFHHLSYSCLGSERREDLLLLCKECHMKEHSLTNPEPSSINSTKENL